MCFFTTAGMFRREVILFIFNFLSRRSRTEIHMNVQMSLRRPKRHVMTFISMSTNMSASNTYALQMREKHIVAMRKEKDFG